MACDPPVLALQMQLGIFHESINKAAERTDKLRAYRGNGRARHAPAERNDEQQVESNIEGRGKEQEHQRRDGVAHAAQKRADEVIEELRADAGKNDGAIGVGRAINLGALGRDVDPREHWVEQHKRQRGEQHRQRSGKNDLASSSNGAHLPDCVRPHCRT